jgi:hypothetical protein
MRYMEKSFNSKFNYPWIFFNDAPFTQEFMDKTQAETAAPCTYGQLVQWSDQVIQSIRRLTSYRTHTQGALGRARLDRSVSDGERF